MTKPIEIGNKFGRLTVETPPERRNGGANYVGTVCVCGTKRYIALADLLRGKQRSCGCMAREVSYLLRQFDEHGQPKYGALVEYRAWSNAKQKIENPRSVSYARNGGRGIKVCDEWGGDFPAFFADMGACPAGFSLVRLNPDADFSKDNCRWSKSKRGQVYEFRGERRTASGWSTILAIPIKIVLDQLEDGLSVAQIYDNFQAQLSEVAA